MSDKNKIIIRRGPSIDLPDSLDEGELGFTTDTSGLFIGTDPDQNLPQADRKRYPYHNVEILTEHSVDTIHQILGEQIKEQSSDDYEMLYLNPLTTDSLIFRAENDPYILADGVFSVLIDYAIHRTSGIPFRIGKLEVSNTSLVDEHDCFRDYPFDPLNINYDPLTNYSSNGLRFSVSGIYLKYTNTLNETLVLRVKKTVLSLYKLANSTKLIATEQDDVISANSKILIKAHVISTMSDDVLVASSRSRIKSSSVILETNDVVSFNAKLSLKSSVNIVEQNDSVMAKAQRPVGAYIQELNDTLVASSKVKISGGMVLSENNDMVGSSSKLKIKASLVSSDGADILSASSSKVAHAILNYTEANDTSSMSGKLFIKSSNVLVEANDIISSSSKLSLTSNATIIEQNDSLNTLGNVKIKGYSLITEQDDTISGDTNTLTRATASIVEANDSFNGLSLLRTRAIGNFVENNDIIVATATLLLQNITLSNTAYTIGAASSGTIQGSSTGSTLSVSGVPSGLTMDTTNRTWTWSGTGTINSYTLTFIETFSGVPNSPRTSTVTVNINYDVDALAYFSVMTSQPDSTRKGLINDLIVGLKADNSWDYINHMLLLASHDSQSALINLKNPSGTSASAVNSPTFTTDRGFKGDGSTSYIDTNFNPTSPPTLNPISQSSGMFMVYLNSAPAIQTATTFGAVQTASPVIRLSFAPRYAANSALFFPLVSNLSSDYAGYNILNTASGLGFFGLLYNGTATRYVATTSNTSISTGTRYTATTALPNVNFTLLKCVTDYSTARVAASVIGSSSANPTGLSTNIRTRLNTYLAAIGAN